ncbi:MAG TPA: ABC transporter permease [Rhizobiales bacterium]|nr:ABC transporter permease [Hyphomicrobiales bacterium]
MSLRNILASVVFLAAIAGLLLPWGVPKLSTFSGILLIGFAVAGIALVTLMKSGFAETSDGQVHHLALAGLFILPHLGAFGLIGLLPHGNGAFDAGYWALVVAVWALAWLLVDTLSATEVTDRFGRAIVPLLVPALFGIWLLILWEIVTRGLGVPPVLLPPPSQIGARIASSLPILWADFQQTFMKAVLIGYAMGCASGFLVAIAIDRSPFLQRGLMPIGNLASALPIVGVAPIMVMWFGFDWPSKAAVVVIMTFFPMLVNTVAGLAATSRIERDLMKTYGAGYWATLRKLRLPQALPFIFNALKINSTLAMIGAIVAEFFGTPIVGMGFRISTEVGRMNVDMVWAEIAVAALAGSLFYGIVTLLERRVTFWHPSMRH